MKSASRIQVNLDLGMGFEGDAFGDTYTNIENVTGSGFDDTIYGDTGDNSLKGIAGNDVLFGCDGNDTIEGGAGNDSMHGGNGVDTLSYAGDESEVYVDLSTSVFTYGAAGDLATGFENITGAAFNDILVGNASTNVLIGGAGNDTLTGKEGVDFLYGGDGDDALYHIAVACDDTREVYDGGNGLDTLSLFTSNTYANDFTNDTLCHLEAITLNGNVGGGTQTILMNANQFGSGFVATGTVNTFTDPSYIFRFVIGMGAETLLDLSQIAFVGETLTTSFNLNGDNRSDTIGDRGIFDTVIGAGANDIITLLYAGSDASEKTIIAAQTASGGHTADDPIPCSSLRDMIGSTYKDTLTGDATSNILEVGGG